MRARGVALLVSALVLSACTATTAGTRETAHREPAATRGVDDPPEGWRWESYQDVRLAVPEDWGYGATGRPWCAPQDGKPFVGRPDFVRTLGCPTTQGQDMKVDPGGQFVWFGLQAKSGPNVDRTPKKLTRVSLAGDRAVIQAGSVRIAVQAPPKLRHQIVDTIRFADTDHNGCPAVPPFAGRPQWRPAGPPVGKLRNVTAVSACRYDKAKLRSSIRITGPQAAEAIAAIKRTPVGIGYYPTSAECVPDLIPLADQILLQIDADVPARVALRYEGCLLPGFDDGTVVHNLTRATVQPFLTWPNRVNGWTNPRLTEILRPDRPGTY